MTHEVGPFVTAFLHLLDDQGPMSAPLIARHHFPGTPSSLQEVLAAEISHALWDAFARGLVGVYQAERGAADYFLLTSAGEAALAAETPAAEEVAEDVPEAQPSPVG